MNINEQLANSSKEYGVGSNRTFFKFEKGDNRIRILTSGEVIATHFFGKGVKAHTCYGIENGCPFHGDKAPRDTKGQEKKPSIKYTCYVKSGDSVMLADLPYSVIKQVGEYQTNQDYSFDSFPMPYDITVKYNPDSPTPNDMYKVFPSPKREPITPDIEEELSEKMRELTPADSVAKKKQWQMDQHDKDGIREEVKPKETREQWARRVNKEMEGKATDFKLDKMTPVDYPTEDIKPEDIPF